MTADVICGALQNVWSIMDVRFDAGVSSEKPRENLGSGHMHGIKREGSALSV
jgi:hypothetical protein